jgi:uncharacterized membrane protein YjjB (DUF3815 family)
MMPEVIVGLLSAVAGTVGFAMLFRVRPKFLFACAIGGFVAYAVYLLTKNFVDGEFFPNVAAAVVTAVFSEICAHKLKAPVQLFTIPSLVPLMPGGALYYSMYYLLAKDTPLALRHAVITLETAFGLAGGVTVGITATAAVLVVIRQCKHYVNQRNTVK